VFGEGGAGVPLPAAAFVSFDATTVTARVGISFVSLDGAKANLAAETGTRSFDEVRTAARDAWNGWLGRIDVTGGTTTQLRTLYTSLYHSPLHPNVFSDVTGQYTGFDRQVHTTTRTRYANFSGWDVYRSQVALIALLAPREAADIAQSAVNQAAQGGYLTVDGRQRRTGVMNGDPMAIVVSTRTRSAARVDTADALRRVAAGVDDVRQRPGWLQFDDYGYVPTGLPTWARRRGHRGALPRRAQNWRNLFESGGKYRRATPTEPAAVQPGAGEQYVEDNAAQYTWMAPHNHRGLFDAMGGDAAVVSRLDTSSPS
ncbi:glycoside hydrolase family 92 protein, partial [Saccharothrix sp. MB29]|nr:glycoside hydrolase family 92 protein [Saccharothrix sp. MB29]